MSILGEPVAGASVVALPSWEEDTLEARACALGGDGTGPLLLDVCGLSDRQLGTLLEELRSDSPEPLHTRTDAQGRFELTGLQEGPYEVWAEAPHGVAVQRLTAGAEGVRLLLEEGALIDGLVRDDDAKPLAAAEVTVFARGFVRRFEQRSAVDGRFRLGRLPAQRYLVQGRHPGLLSQVKEREPGRDRPVSLVLRVPRILPGRVVRGGVGVAGARVRASNPWSGDSWRTSDAQGFFTFNDTPRGEYTLDARLGGELGVAYVNFVDPSKVTEPVVLELRPCSRVEGRVTARSGAPIAGAEVRFWRRQPTRSHFAQTDSEGGYAFDCLLRADFTAQIEAEGFHEWVEMMDPTALAAGETWRLDWVLEEAAAFRGHVVDREGRGIPGARVSVTAESMDEPEAEIVELGEAVATTGSDGRFSLRDRVAGTYSVEIHGPEGWGSRRERVRLPLTDARFVLEPSAPAPGILVGTVVDEQGRPLEGVVVQVVTEGLVRPLVKTNGAGQFRLRKLSLGRWRAIASHEELDEDQPRVTASREVVLSGPEPVRVDFQLSSGLDVAGQVVDWRGAPVVSASVRFFRAGGGDGARLGRVETDEQGRFALRHLAPGDLDVEVRPPIGEPQSLSDSVEFSIDDIQGGSSEDVPRLRSVRTTVRAGDSDVRIVLSPR